MESLLTKEEVAVYYKVSTQTIYRWIKEGKITPVTRGRKRMFDRKTLEPAIDSYEARPTNTATA